MNRWRPMMGGVFFAIGLLFFQGCAGLRASHEPEGRFQRGLLADRSDYQRVLNKWTRTGRIYQGFDLELIFSGTFKSSEFRSAFKEETARVYQLPEAEKTKLAQDQRRAGLEHNEFILAAYVPEEKENDFDKKKSIWKIYLVLDENLPESPLEIRKIDKKDASLIHFFPHITPWQSVYIVRFPVAFSKSGGRLMGDGAKIIKLVVTGVAGAAELEWNVKELDRKIERPFLKPVTPVQPHASHMDGS